MEYSDFTSKMSVFIHLAQSRCEARGAKCIITYHHGNTKKNNGNYPF